MKNTKPYTWKAALAGVSFVSLIASGAMAQDQGADADDVVAVEEVVVTGSRISRAGFDTVQPATVVDSDFMDIRGFDNAAGALNEIPQFGLPAASNLGGQSAQNLGQNIVSLFGLGSQRTLTLINGRRTVGQNTPALGGAAPGLQVDLNIIPTGLIDRIETIETGGAPIYGSDAIAGTVNIILKDDFEGLQTDFQYGMNQDGNGDSVRWRSLLGGNFGGGRGNVVISFEYSDQIAVDASDRPDLVNSPAFVPNPADTGPSDGVVDTIFMDDALNVFQVPNTGFLMLRNDAVRSDFTSFITGGQVLLEDAGGTPVMLGFDGELIDVADANLGTPFDGAVSFFSQGADGVNNPFVTELDETNTFISPLERYTVNTLGHYDINDDVTIFYEALYNRSESVDRSNQPAWSTLFFDNANNGALGAFRINMVDNPFVSQQLKDVAATNMVPIGEDDDGNPILAPLFDPDNADSPNEIWIARSNIDIIGDSPNFRDQDVFRFVGGLRGDVPVFNRQWDWEFYYNFGQTNASTSQTVVNGRRLSFATDVVLDANGDPACRVVAEGQIPIDNDGGLPGAGTDFDVADCVPINVLDFGSASQEALDFVLQRQVQSSQIQQSVVSANITGDVIDLPAGPVGMAMGVTHRRERASFDVGQGARMGVAPNTPTLPVSGGFNTWEWYAETLVPLASGDVGLPIFRSFFDDARFEGAIRVVDNNFAGTDSTWTVGFRGTPAIMGGMIAVRGNYTEAIRSPAITELFLPQISVGTFAIDPCDQRDIESGNNPAQRRANCEAAVAALADTLDPAFNLDEFRAISRNASQAAITGGNPNLDNEQSEAVSIGAIITPDRWFPGLEVSVDWTDIEISDAIVNLSATNILAACFDSPNFPNVAACDRFQRDPVTFQPSNFITGFVNAASRTFEGLTVQATYTTELADIHEALAGSVRITGNYFHIIESQQRVGEGDLNIFKGIFGSEADQYQVNLTYNLDRFTGFLQVQGDTGGLFSPNDFAAGNDEARDIDKFPGYKEFNLSLRYDITDHFWGQFNLNNALDAKNKPLRQAAVGSNANNLDNVLGRNFLFSVGANF